MSHVIPYVCLLVNSVDKVGDFLISVFSAEQDESEEKTVLHRTIRLLTGSSIILVAKDSCNENTLATFGLLAVKHVFISVENLEKVRLSSIKLGAEVSNSDHTDSITINISGEMNQVIIHAMNADSSVKQTPLDFIMKNILSPPTPNSTNSTTASSITVTAQSTTTNNTTSNNTDTSPREGSATASLVSPRQNRPKHPPRPNITTFESTILSNKMYVPCPPNSREVSSSGGLRMCTLSNVCTY